MSSILLLLALSLPGQADSGLVTEVRSDGSLVLDDGRTVELVGITIANSPAAIQWLQVFVQDRRISLRNPQHVGFATIRAQVVILGTMDLNGLLILTGNARIDKPESVTVKVYDQWRGYEAKASQKRLGLWSTTAPKPAVIIRNEGAL